jgi:hypothetical protein
MSLKLHPDYGLNPSCSICFWCNESKDVVLFGKAYPGGGEAPSKIVMDYEPCATCTANFQLGVTCVEVQPSNQQLVLQAGLAPTGRLSVITTEAAERLFEDQPEVLKQGKVLLDKDAYEIMFGDKNETQDGQ